jgi:uncharacterized protein YjbJ (UPF0337 family)
MCCCDRRGTGLSASWLKCTADDLRRYAMNWDQIEGKWKQLSGRAREKWGKLTDSDWQIVAGKKSQLIGRIQERYGLAKDEAERQADEWARTLEEGQPTAR